MLAQIVLVLQFPGGRLYLGIDLLAAVSHLGDLLKHNRIMYGFKWVPAPGEGTMVLAQASWHSGRVLAEPGKFAHDEETGIALVGFFNLFQFFRRSVFGDVDSFMYIIFAQSSDVGKQSCFTEARIIKLLKVYQLNVLTARNERHLFLCLVHNLTRVIDRQGHLGHDFTAGQ